MKPEHITAWALNELSPEERERIESALRADPQAVQTADETKEFCEFLLTELRGESLAFTPEQRQRLQSTETAPPVAPVVKPVRWSFVSRLAPLAAAAACAVLGLFLVIRSFPGSSKSVAVQDTEMRYQVRLQEPEGARLKEVAKLEKLGSGPPAPAAADSPVARALALTAPMGNHPQLKMNEPGSESRAAMPVGGRLGDSSAGKELADAMRIESKPLDVVTFGNSSMAIVAPSASQPPSPASPKPAPFASGQGLVVVNPVGQTEKLLRDSAAGTMYESQAKADDFAKVRPQLDSTSSESYTAIVENELKEVLREPLSTFSIDVDTASYANMRRFLNQNTIPPKDAVRIEELVNYFPTGEAGPAADAAEPFAASVEVASCPWAPKHKLARIAIKGREVEMGSKASNLVFLVDVSGSMNSPQKLPLVQQSLRMLAEQMSEGDSVSMVTYAGGTQVVLPPTNGEKRADIIAAIERLRAGGSTNGAGGLQLAYEQAVAGFIKGGINRVILCTDGDFNVGISQPAELEKVITQRAKSGVFLSVLGFGSGNLKDRTMETLADKGNGNYAYIDGLAEARKVLVEQMNGTLVTIAKDVKIQIEFNPVMVRSYRLIGYENRLLAKEDFNDDTKDAGEIGSGHSVVALYELVPASLPPGDEPHILVDTLKYQTLASPAPEPVPTKLTPTASSGELMTVKLRYKQPEGETSAKIELPVPDSDKALAKASGEFKFSAAVAGFGLLLRDSTYKGGLNWETVRRLALDGKGSDNLGYRGEFLQLIDKARGLKATQP